MQVCNNPSSPCGQGTDSSYYRPREGGLQSCCTVLSYVWWYGVQCRGVVDRPGESRSQQVSWRPPVLPQKRLRGWLRGRLPLESPSVRRLEGVADGRLEAYSGGDGDVLLSRAPTATGMALQYSGWRHSGGDGRTGPTVTEETRYTGPISRRRPVRARGRRPYHFLGFRCPLSRGAACRPYGSGRHSVTELTPAFPHSSPTAPGMASRGGFVEQRRDTIPRRCQRAGVARICL
jgi:hypothetical protein